MDKIEQFNANYAGQYLGDEWVVRASQLDQCIEVKNELARDLDQARQIITELVAFCEQPEIVAATDGAFDPDATIQAAKRFLSGGEHE